jgi:hypothetical protein
MGIDRFESEEAQGLERVVAVLPDAESADRAAIRIESEKVAVGDVSVLDGRMLDVIRARGGVPIPEMLGGAVVGALLTLFVASFVPALNSLVLPGEPTVMIVVAVGALLGAAASWVLARRPRRIGALAELHGRERLVVLTTAHDRVDRVEALVRQEGGHAARMRAA